MDLTIGKQNKRHISISIERQLIDLIERLKQETIGSKRDINKSKPGFFHMYTETLSNLGYNCGPNAKDFEFEKVVKDTALLKRIKNAHSGRMIRLAQGSTEALSILDKGKIVNQPTLFATLSLLDFYILIECLDDLTLLKIFRGDKYQDFENLSFDELKHKLTFSAYDEE